MLTDRRRVEIALPAEFFCVLAKSSCFSDVDAPEVAELRRLMIAAAHEPFADLPPKTARKLMARVIRAHAAVTNPLYDRPASEVAIALFYWLEDLLSRSVLDLHEGSDFALGFEILRPMFEHDFADRELDASARRAARTLLADLQALGYVQTA